jgi:hypothetical protein
VDDRSTHKTQLTSNNVSSSSEASLLPEDKERGSQHHRLERRHNAYTKVEVWERHMRRVELPRCNAAR